MQIRWGFRVDTENPEGGGIAERCLLTTLFTLFTLFPNCSPQPLSTLPKPDTINDTNQLLHVRQYSPYLNHLLWTHEELQYISDPKQPHSLIHISSNATKPVLKRMSIKFELRNKGCHKSSSNPGNKQHFNFLEIFTSLQSSKKATKTALTGEWIQIKAKRHCCGR